MKRTVIFAIGLTLSLIVISPNNLIAGDSSGGGSITLKMKCDELSSGSAFMENGLVVYITGEINQRTVSVETKGTLNPPLVYLNRCQGDLSDLDCDSTNQILPAGHLDKFTVTEVGGSYSGKLIRERDLAPQQVNLFSCIRYPD